MINILIMVNLRRSFLNNSKHLSEYNLRKIVFVFWFYSFILVDYS